jgi:hypothetical protein
MLKPIFGRGKFDHGLEGARKAERVFVSGQPGDFFEQNWPRVKCEIGMCRQMIKVKAVWT